MNYDRHLIDTIKTHFARKSSAQLQEIAQSNNSERWSPEAVEAAGQVLQERMAGRAQEPLVPEEEPPPPPVTYNPDLIALAVLGGLMTGHLIIPYQRRVEIECPDLPVPFGSKLAWLALETTDTQAVAAVLGLREARPATWAVGIDAAHHASFFITPPLADWTLVASTALITRDRVDASVKPLLVGLSRQFGDAQYFCTNREVELHVWARARQGQFVRGYAWLGEKRLTLWDEGRQTKEERDLGFQFLNPESISASPGPGRQAQQVPDEACVMQLASLWSIDPTTLDEYFKEPATGLLGNVASGDSRDALH